MNKPCRLIAITLCILAMSSTTATPRLKIKPSLSISLNNRSISTNIENNYYLSSLAGASGHIKQYAYIPFGSTASTANNNYYLHTDNYLGPGYTYIEDNTFTLKKTGIAQANAQNTDAIDGNKLLVLLYTADVQALGYIATNGQLLFPIESVETADAISTLTFPDLYQSWDGLTEVLNSRIDAPLGYSSAPAPSYSYETDDANGDVKHLVINTNEGQNGSVFNYPNYAIKKYYIQDSNKKYYIVMGTTVESPEVGSIINNTNYFNKLITYTPTTDTNTYTQMDYEHIKYYGITLGLTAEYALTDHIYINLQTDLTTPIEKIEHTGKFVSLRPEADIGIKGGLSFGNKNGAIGLLYGVAYDRYTAVLKRFTSPVGGRYLETNETQLRTFAVCREINANIRLNSQIDAYFSTILTDNDYKVDLKGSNERSPVTDQRFAFGFLMNY